ncbi:dihydrolipoyllysine-residue acetyltransferase [bacterium]|nr:dihydrolipoyllysine-residue acetyltransferase [bacterium]
MAKQQVTVPDIGGAEGAEVIELLVAVGDEIAMDQSLIVLESDKASMEIPSTAAGTLVELLVSEGEQLAEGSVVAIIEAAAESLTQPAVAPSAAGDSEPEQEKEAATEAEVVAPAVASVVSPAQTAEQVVPVPDIGTDEAVELIEVCVKVGDAVAEGDSLVVLESDKASMEVPAPAAGEVLEILVAEGASVKQGDPLLRLRSAVGDSIAPAPAPAPAAVPAQQSTPIAGPEAAAVSPARPAAAAPTASNKDIYAGPAVRKLAREFGVELGLVTGTGPRSRILKEDLQLFVQNSLKAAPAAAGGGALPLIPEIDFSAFGEVEITQRSKLDKLTAANMQRNWLNVPHVTQFDEADITELEVFRASLKAEAEQRGTRLTPMPFLLKACAVALRDNPKFCSGLAADGEQLVYKKYIHIGMAVDTPAGLVVPVIRDVDKKTIWELAEEVLSLAGKARDRKLTPTQMQGGCFTISSLGNIGGNGFTPIVNAPEVGILGVSRAAMRPVWDGEVFAPRKMLPLSLSYDHRVINGGDGGRFFARLLTLLADIRQLAM